MDRSCDVEPLRCGNEVLGHLFAIAFGLHGPAFIIVAGITSKRRESVRCQGQESVHGKPSCHVGDVRIQAAIFVDDQDSRKFPIAGRPFVSWSGQQPLHFPCSVWRGVADRFGLDPRVIWLDLLGPRVVRCEVREKRLDSQATHGESGHSLEVLAAIDPTMGVIIIDLQHSGIEFVGSFALHERWSSSELDKQDGGRPEADMAWTRDELRSTTFFTYS